jgi:hypothetical protein
MGYGLGLWVRVKSYGLWVMGKSYGLWVMVICLG